MNCHRCGFANDAGARFCNNCAAAFNVSPSQQKSKSDTWKWALGILGGLCVLSAIFSSLVKQPSSPQSVTAPPSAPAKPPSQTVTTGCDCEVYEDKNLEILAARDEAAFDELNRVSNAKDYYGLSQMIATGRAFVLTHRTHVLVIDAGFLSHTVRVLEGPHRGKSAIVAVEFIKKRA